jgi:2-oxoglutarate ferredoxin oxidoreductase subunit gamma|uniref:2-oxoacid:ferredoxin oxidoreductase subunit gamma n=1 Tax=Desulfobacca acetoxidans TaxID=60893 RepID=A0A7V6DQV5_9BACT
MANRLEIRLAGSGGQGLIMAGMILAEAAGIHEGKFVTQTQSYGPEARGGASKSEVVVSDEEIDYPPAMKPDILLCMNQAACDTYIFDVKPGGRLIVDSSLVHSLPTTRAIGLPFTKVAREEVGQEMMANIVALAALATLTGVVSRESLEEAVLARVPKGTEALNRQAVEAGVKLAQEWMEQKKLPES